jgi:hypothetical protein
MVAAPSSPTTSSRREEGEELAKQLLQSRKRSPPGYWQDTVIREYVPEVLRILKSQGRRHPTIRRVFYTVAQMHADFPKTKAGYTNLSRHLTDVRLRRKGKDADYRYWDGYDYKLDEFTDDSRSETQVPRFVRPKRFVQEHVLGMMYVFNQYEPNRWEGQDHVVEIMIEKRTMENTVKDIVQPKQVTAFPNSGSDGLSHQVDQYLRWKEYQRQGKDVHIGYLGDLDAWGEHMDKKDYVKRLLQMIRVDVENGEEPLNWNWTKEDWDNDDPYNKAKGDVFKNYYDKDKPAFTLERIGLTENQVNDYNLMKIDVQHIMEINNPAIQQINFAKRHGGYVYTVELDAIVILNEQAFKDMINEFVDRWYDYDIWEKVKPLLSDDVKDKELNKRITINKLAYQEYEQWSNDQLELDDEVDLNEIQAESLVRDDLSDLEPPGDLAPKSSVLYDDPVSKESKIEIRSHPNAIHKARKERREREHRERDVKDLKEARQEIAQLPDDKQKLNRLLSDKERYQKIVSDIEPDPDYIDGRPRHVWKLMYHSLDYYKQRLKDTESDLKRLREMGIIDDD